MTNDEIVSGLKNATERGSSLEEAVQSFINAGYNPAEVRAAAEFLTSGAFSVSSPVKFNFSPAQIKSPPTKKPFPVQVEIQKPSNSETLIIQQKKKSSIALIFIIILFILLAFIIGFALTAIFFGDQILEILFG